MINLKQLLIGATVVGGLTGLLGRAQDGGNIPIYESSFLPMVEGTGVGLTSGDFDRDGDTDIIAASVDDAGPSQGLLYLYRNNGDGTFEFPYSFAIFPSAGISTTTMTSGDFDRDGDLDLIVSGQDNNTDRQEGTLYLLRNNGVGKGTVSGLLQYFDNPSPIATLPAYSMAGISLTANDFDRDGDLDLIVSGRDTRDEASPFVARLFQIQNDGRGNFVDLARLH